MASRFTSTGISLFAPPHYCMLYNSKTVIWSDNQYNKQAHGKTANKIQTHAKSGTMTRKGAAPALPARCDSMVAWVAKIPNMAVDGSTIDCPGYKVQTRVHQSMSLIMVKERTMSVYMHPTTPRAMSDVVRNTSVSDRFGRTKSSCSKIIHFVVAVVPLKWSFR